MEDNEKKRKTCATKNVSANLLKESKRLKKASKEQKISSNTEKIFKERGRTPSGTVLAGKVSGIRNYFSPKGEKFKFSAVAGRNSQNQLRLLRRQNQRTKSQSAMATCVQSTVNDDKNNNKSDQGQQDVSSGQTVDEHDNLRGATASLDANALQQLGALKESKESKEQEDQFIYQLAGLLRTLTDEEVDQMIENRRKQSKQTTQQNLLQLNMVENREQNDDMPQVMSLPNVVQLMTQFKAEVAKENKELRVGIKKDLQDFKRDCIEEVKKDLDSVIEKSKKVRRVETELQFWKVKSDTLAEVCDRMSTEIADLSSRVSNLELTNSKKMLVLTGVKLEKIEGKEAKQVNIAFLSSFMDQFLGINVQIDDFFTLGLQEPKPVVLILKSVEDKRLILNNKSKLKNVKGDNDRYIYINDYLPPEAQEKKRRDQDIVDQMNEQGRSDQVAYKKGLITVQGQTYKKKVVPPTPAELVNMPPEEMQQVLKMPIDHGFELTKQNSKFVAYHANVTNHQQIQQLYKKMKLIKPAARHIVCCYWIDDQYPCYSKDYHDDGEPGVGRQILDLMVAKQLKNKVIFAVRHYGGTKMGTDRFTCYMKAVKSALGIDPNEVIKKEPKPRYRSQGRGGGQSNRGYYAGRGNASSQNKFRQNRPEKSHNSYSNAAQQGHMQLQPKQLSNYQPIRFNNPQQPINVPTPTRYQQLQSQMQKLSDMAIWPDLPAPSSVSPSSQLLASLNNFQGMQNNQTPYKRLVSPPSPRTNSTAAPSTIDTDGESNHMEYEFSEPEGVNRDVVSNEEWQDDKQGQWTSVNNENSPSVINI